MMDYQHRDQITVNIVCWMERVKEGKRMGLWRHEVPGLLFKSAINVRYFYKINICYFRDIVYFILYERLTLIYLNIDDSLRNYLPALIRK